MAEEDARPAPDSDPAEAEEPASKEADAAADDDEDLADDDDEEVRYADHPVPTEAEFLEALRWAFEGQDGVPEGMLETFAKHAVMLAEENTRMNLTRIMEPREVAAKHYLDSWQATRLLPLVAKRVLDAGTGAGFPGIPIAVAEPNTHVVLLDSTKKKADFNQRAIEALGLANAEVVWDRAEEHLARNKYDVVFMRAVSSVRENVRLLRKVRHSLQDLVMLKGKTWSREVRAGEREAERLGFRLDTVWEHELPGEMGKRAVLVYRAPGGAGMA